MYIMQYSFLMKNHKQGKQMQDIFKKAIQSSWIIVKLVVPFSIASDLLQYFGIIESISFIFEPFTNSLNLPSDVAISFASAIFFNLYAGIAVASTLNLSGYEWTIVGTFMAICHSLPLETAVLKKVGMGLKVHWVSRILLGYFGALIAMHVTPNDFNLLQENANFTLSTHETFVEALLNSIYNSCMLALKVIILVVSLVVLFELIKKMTFFDKLLNKYAYLSSLFIGGLLGVTYGAGILLQEIERVKKRAKILLLTFLMLAHGLVEETLIFGFVGANILAIFLIRVFIALIVVVFVSLLTKKR